MQTRAQPRLILVSADLPPMRPRPAMRACAGAPDAHIARAAMRRREVMVTLAGVGVAILLQVAYAFAAGGAAF
jgi:hypothetical protein